MLINAAQKSVELWATNADSIGRETPLIPEWGSLPVGAIIRAYRLGLIVRSNLAEPFKWQEIWSNFSQTYSMSHTMLILW